MTSPSKQSGSPKRSKFTSFEEYVKEHGEEEAVPFDDMLRKLVKSAARVAQRKVHKEE